MHQSAHSVHRDLTSPSSWGKHPERARIAVQQALCRLTANRVTNGDMAGMSNFPHPGHEKKCFTGRDVVRRDILVVRDAKEVTDDGQKLGKGLYAREDIPGFQDLGRLQGVLVHAARPFTTRYTFTAFEDTTDVLYVSTGNPVLGRANDPRNVKGAEANVKLILYDDNAETNGAIDLHLVTKCKIAKGQTITC